MYKTDEELNQAEKMAKRHGVRMCDENGDTHGEDLYCVGIDDIADIIREARAEQDHIADAGKMIAEPVKQEPVALSFPREPKPENAMGWTIDYGLIRQIAEDIGDQEFYPGYEGIELTLMALEHIYTAQVPDRLAAAAHDLLKELQECRDLLKCVETCSRNNFENLADERVQAINAVIAAFKEKNK